MTALLQRVYACGAWVFRWNNQQEDDRGSYPGELTQDQVAYLHELAEERRRAWMEQNRES